MTLRNATLCDSVAVVGLGVVYESKTVSLNLRTKITVEPCLVVCAADIKFEYKSEARHRLRSNEGSDGALGPQSLGCLGQGMCAQGRSRKGGKTDLRGQLL